MMGSRKIKTVSASTVVKIKISNDFFTGKAPLYFCYVNYSTETGKRQDREWVTWKKENRLPTCEIPWFAISVQTGAAHAGCVFVICKNLTFLLYLYEKCGKLN